MLRLLGGHWETNVDAAWRSALVLGGCYRSRCFCYCCCGLGVRACRAFVSLLVIVLVVSTCGNCFKVFCRPIGNSGVQKVSSTIAKPSVNGGKRRRFCGLVTTAEASTAPLPPQSLVLCPSPSPQPYHVVRFQKLG